MSDVDDLRQVLRDLDGDLLVFIETPDGPRAIVAYADVNVEGLAGGIVLKPEAAASVLGADTIVIKRR